MSTTDLEHCEEKQGIENETELAGLLTTPTTDIPSDIPESSRIMSENQEMDVNAVDDEKSSSPILRHRINSNTRPINDISNELPTDNASTSPETGEQSTIPPPTYLQIYPNDLKDRASTSNVLEQSKPLNPDKERLIAIVKPTNSEQPSSNILVMQKDDIATSASRNTSTYELDYIHDKEINTSLSELKPMNNPPQDDTSKDMQQESGILSVDFDAILPHVGEMGRYQLALYLLMCIPATLPAAFLAFNQVFLSATPSHWCKIDHLYQYNNVGPNQQN